MRTAVILGVSDDLVVKTNERAVQQAATRYFRMVSVAVGAAGRAATKMPAGGAFLEKVGQVAVGGGDAAALVVKTIRLGALEQLTECCNKTRAIQRTVI